VRRALRLLCVAVIFTCVTFILIDMWRSDFILGAFVTALVAAVCLGILADGEK